MVTHCPAFTGLYSFFLNILRPRAIRVSACVCRGLSSVLCYGVALTPPTETGVSHSVSTDWTYLFLPSEFLCRTLPLLHSHHPILMSECLTPSLSS